MNAPMAVPKFVPVPNAKGCRTKQRKAAAQFRLLILDLLTLNGPIGSRALSELSGSSMSTLRDHLDHLMTKGLVESERVNGRNHPTGGTVMCLYRIASDEPIGRQFVASQRTVHHYPLNHVRGPMVAALFGAAAPTPPA